MLRHLLAGAAALALATAANAATYAIQAGKLIVDAAKPALGQSTVIVDNGRITPGLIRMSVNQVVTHCDQPLSDGDEVAFFSVFSGG